MLIKSELYTADNGSPMVRKYYGISEDEITAVVDSSAVEGVVEGAVVDSSAVEGVVEGAVVDSSAVEGDGIRQDEILARLLLNQAEIMTLLLKSNAGGDTDV